MNFVLSIISAVILLTLIAGGVHGCKKQDTESAVKVSLSVKDAIGFESLDPPEREKICENHAMIVYVGNAENMGEVSFSPALQKDSKKTAAYTATGKRKNDTYFKVVKEGGVDLYNSLKETQCDSYMDTTVTLLRVLDGPGAKDSAIYSTRYAFKEVTSHMKTKGSTQVWSVVEEKSWKFGAGKLEPLKSGEAFEINLPASLEAIVRQAMTEASKAKDVTQVIYFIKGHGGLVSTQREAKPAGFYDFVSGDLKKTIKKENLKHVLLFDANGEDGKPLTSEVFSYMWSKENSCSLLQKDAAKYKDLIKEIGCDVTSYKDCLAKYPKEPLHCRHLYPQIAVKRSGQGNDGGDGQGNDGGDGQGNDGGDGQGNDGGDGQGNDGGDGQGNDGGDGQGNDGGDGQGNDGGDGQGNDGGDGQGPGKQMMFLSSSTAKPELNGEAKASDSKPDWIKVIGAMATYDLDVKDGKSWDKNISVLRLPIPPKAKAPSMVVLDSCYGAEEVFNAVGSDVRKDPAQLKEMFQHSSRKEHAIITLSNPKPTYYYTVNYDLLNATGYLAIPNIFYWSHTGDSGSTDQVPVIAQALRHALLNPEAEDRAQLVKNFEKIEKSVTTDSVDNDWLKLEPGIFIIKN